MTLGDLITWTPMVVGFSLALYFWRQESRAAKEDRDTPFDIPIRDAIHHLVLTIPHSFDRPSFAEQAMFKQLHHRMCNGSLSVVGTPGEIVGPQRIPPKKCRKLDPVEVVIPQSEAAPEGVRFSLVRYSDNVEVEYTALAVRSDDLYRIWPKPKKKN